MIVKFKPGDVVSYGNITFPDGIVHSGNKLLVILNEGIDKPLVFVLTTSKQHHRHKTAGCQSRYGYLFVPKRKEDCRCGFNEDTWLEINRPLHHNPDEFMEKANRGIIRTIFNINETGLTSHEDIIRCVIDAKNISTELLSYLMG